MSLKSEGFSWKLIPQPTSPTPIPLIEAERKEKKRKRNQTLRGTADQEF